MWSFRRDPESLTAEERKALEGLFETLPELKELYRVRLRFQELFDTARDRTTAARWLRELRREAEQLGLDAFQRWTFDTPGGGEVTGLSYGHPVVERLAGG